MPSLKRKSLRVQTKRSNVAIVTRSQSSRPHHTPPEVAPPIEGVNEEDDASQYETDSEHEIQEEYEATNLAKSHPSPTLLGRKEKRKNLPLNAIPPFNEFNALEWIRQTTMIFNLNEIIDQRERVRLLASKLPSKITNSLKLPLKDDCYTKLVKVIEKLYAPSLRTQIEEVFQSGMREGELPSDYAVRIKEMLGLSTFDSITDNDAKFIRELFLLRLPKQLQISLMTTEKNHDFEELIEIADDIFNKFFSPNGVRQSPAVGGSEWQSVNAVRPAEEKVTKPPNRETSAQEREISRPVSYTHLRA